MLKFHVLRNISTIYATVSKRKKKSKLPLLNANSKHNFSKCKDEGPCWPVAWPDFEICLNNGFKMPILGLGTWKMSKCVVFNSVSHALDVGYRHIDCAHIHRNEFEIGKALTKKMQECVIRRENLFVTSKLWNTFHRPDLVKDACIKSLTHLNLDYLDMYLIHWPMAYLEGKDLVPYDLCGRVRFSCVDYVDTWKAMEELVTCGLCKSIGVSNFNQYQLERILKVARIPPAVNQVECHSYLNQYELMEYCHSKDIVITAYSPLGSPDRPCKRPNEPVLLKDMALTILARRYHKTPAQILLRYQVQRGNVVIPKAAHKEHIEENTDIFNFYLGKDDMDMIDNFEYRGRYISMDTQAAAHIYYPFKDELITKPKGKEGRILEHCCIRKECITPIT